MTSTIKADRVVHTGRSGRAAVGVWLLGIALCASAAADDEMRIGYIGLERGDQEPLSLLDPVLDDDGVQGARLAIVDNNGTGRFLGQEYVLSEIILERDGDAAAAFEELVENGAQWIVSGLPIEQLRQMLASPLARSGVTIFNARAADDVLRNEECRANLFHTVPSRAMQTDALAQFLTYKRWNRWALVIGNTEQDARHAEALRRSAQRFGGNIVGELQWPHTPLARRAEGGFHAIQREVPVLLQNLPDHDVLLLVDETDYFGEYVPYQTWRPRPVGGTQGLVATAWHRAHESWGAVQLHRRFESHAERPMTPLDFAAWVAVRAVGEAATRSGSAPEEIVSYMLGEDFELGAYLGHPLTFRIWDRQLRQPMLVTGPRMVASVSPQEGFIHPRTPLDSLGHDEIESACELE